MITISTLKLAICLLLIILLTAKVVYRIAFHKGKIKGWNDGYNSCEKRIYEQFPEIKEKREQYKFSNLMKFLEGED